MSMLLGELSTSKKKLGRVFASQGGDLQRISGLAREKDGVARENARIE